MSSGKFAKLPFCALLAAVALGCASEDENSATGATGDAGQVSGSTATDAGSTGSTGSTGTDAGTTGSTGSTATDAGSTGSTGSTGTDAGGGAAADAGGNTGTGDAGGAASDGGSTNAGTLGKFSFFVTSQASIVKVSGAADGFGGDLRYGETGTGAGIRGADKICEAIAEMSMPGSSVKQWRAFLSASTGGASGGALNARDRIGSGPWYDRQGRLVGNTLDDLIGGIRPKSAATEIAKDLPNETGTPNHNPGNGQVDNHDTLTGSDGNGRYVSGAPTCEDWTTAPAKTSGGGRGGGGGPAVGHSWPRNGDVSSAGSGHWLAAHTAGGCAKGFNTSDASASDGSNSVGSGGGYGGFYCFALMP
ncbi:MAG: hypothetical protein RL385_1140 [Pseudomonadota bacterium]|jgi:hypothetical protein